MELWLQRRPQRECYSKIAGDVLQKYVAYQMRLAIVGDFTSGCSPLWLAFILESNKGKALNWMIS